MSDPRETEQAMPFRFPITWSTLVDSSAVPVDQALIVAPRSAAGGPGAQWSMVIPKLASPAAATLLLPAPAAPADGPQFAAPQYVVPKFEVRSDSASLAVKLLLSSFVALLLVPGWRDTGSPGARAVEAESSMGARGWIHRSPQLVLFEPSLGKSDYRMEFYWRIQPQGIAWVFRVKDKDNYYSVRIKPLAANSSGMLALSHSVVYRGAEKSRVTKSIAAPGDAPGLGIRMDVAGSQFKLYVDGNLLAQWADGRLPAGGAGFLEDANQRTQVQSFRVLFTP